MFDVSSLIDPVSEFVGKFFSGLFHSRGTDATDVSDALDDVDAVDAIKAIDTLEVIDEDIDTEDLGTESEVDDGVLASVDTGEGVDLSSGSTPPEESETSVSSQGGILQEASSGSGTSSGPGKRYKEYRVPFGNALGCNICSCKCYVGGDGAYSVCTCGHQKCQHLWG